MLKSLYVVYTILCLTNVIELIKWDVWHGMILSKNKSESQNSRTPCSNSVHRKFVLKKSTCLEPVPMALITPSRSDHRESLIFRTHSTDCQSSDKALFRKMRACMNELRSHTTTRLTSLRAGELYMWAGGRNCLAWTLQLLCVELSRFLTHQTIFCRHELRKRCTYLRINIILFSSQMFS